MANIKIGSRGLSANDIVTLMAYNQGGNRGTAGAIVDVGLTLFQIR